MATGLQTQRPILTQVLRTTKTEFLLKQTMFYSIFSALFIAVGYLAAQPRKVWNFYEATKM